jgi:serine protease Do
MERLFKMAVLPNGIEGEENRSVTGGLIEMSRRWGSLAIAAVTMTLLAGFAYPQQALAEVGGQRYTIAVTKGGSIQEGPDVVRILRGAAGAGYLGVRLEEITADNKAKLGLPKEEGALVQEVEKESPASAAGILKDDVIVSYAGYPVFSAAQLARLVSETPVGRRVEVGVLRAGKRLNLEAKIDKRGGETSSFDLQLPHREGRVLIRPDIWSDPTWENLGKYFSFSTSDRPRLGVSIVEISDQLAEKYGLKGKQGALVMSVTSGSPAEKAGIKAGDVITEINGRTISGSDSITSALRRADDKELEIKLYRDRQPMTLKAQLEKSSSPASGKGRVVL